MSSLDYRSHAAQRRCAIRPYVKARLQESARLHSIVETILWDRLARRLASEQSPVTVDVVPLCFATVMDVVTGHAFGLALAPDLLGDDNKRLLYQRAHHEASAQRPMFWAQELPLLCSMLPQPSRVTGAKSFLESMVLSLCMQANAPCCRQTEGSLSPSLYYVIRDELHRHSPAMPKECLERKVASELLDHFKAASDVLSITLIHAMYELSRNQPAQDELRSELRAMWQPDHRWLPQAKHLDQLPYLDAVVCETLRLRPTAPDGQPRVTRSAVPTDNGTVIPRNTRISTYPYVLHHDEHVFPKAHEWTPERWMDSGLKPNEHLWAFGVGPRACLGRNMAITSESRKVVTRCELTSAVIKYFLAFTYQSHRTEIRDASKWRQRDGDFANLDDSLWLTVTRYE